MTDKTLLVNTSHDQVVEFDPMQIAESLQIETGLDKETSEEVAKETASKVRGSGINRLSTNLIREIICAILVEKGLNTTRKKYQRLGVPVYDVDQLVLNQNKENANIPHGPEATNLTIAEDVKKGYALVKVFSSDVADSHMQGDIHIHDMGFIDRPYCSGQSIEYVKRFGLNLPNSLANARPAKYAEILVAHIVKFAAALQCNFAGAIGWDAVNIFIAPYMVDKTYREHKQIAQMLIYEFSQQAVARGGQAIFSDINLYWEMPKHFKDTQAIGPGGEFTGKTYDSYKEEAQTFVKALMEVYLEGDSCGRPFFFPKPLVHITKSFWLEEGHEEFLILLCKVAAKMGNTYFVFDRGDTAKISECCRLSFKLTSEDIKDAQQPWRMRFSALQNVSINLPRVAYKARGNDDNLIKFMHSKMEDAFKAHKQKKAFIEKILSYGEQSPLALLTMNLDGDPYLKLEKCSYLIGMVGLNEMVKAHMGGDLQDTDKSKRLGMRVIAEMNVACKKASERDGLKYVLEQTPAESTAYRFARLDTERYEKAKEVVNGCEGEYYYTNSTHIPVAAEASPMKRIGFEGMFHPMIEAGSITHIWMGEENPYPESLANIVKRTYEETTNDQIAFSPEFTFCNDCHKTVRGLHDTCLYCGTENVDGITRITGYFTKTSSWNKGKLAELRDRRREI